MADQNCALQQLNAYQSDILTLFQGVLKERNEYKEGNDFLSETIKQVSNKVENLERQNELLRTFNSSMKCIFSVGVVAFKKVDFSQVSCTEDNLTYLELLKKIFIDLSIKITDPALRTLCENTSQSLNKGAVGMIKFKELDDKTEIKNIDFCDAEAVTQLIENFNNIGDTFMKEVKKEAEDNSIEWTSWAFSKYLNSASTVATKEVKNSLFDEVDAASSGDANATSSASVSDRVESKPGPSSFLEGEFINAQIQDYKHSQENISPQKLAKKKFMKNSVHTPSISPRKKSSFDRCPSSKASVTRKHTKMLANLNVQKRSPGEFRSILKEPGGSGKKLAQSVLDLKFVKQKGPETGNNSENGKDGNFNNPINTFKREVQVICDSDSDDFITESPIKLNQGLEERGMNDGDSNLDETFINSSVIRKFNLKHNHIVERIFKTSTQRKRAKKKSPEYDSVPFAYKRGTVRKRRERMKLPGHPCVECNKYYENALADLDSSDVKKILNKCSRHRDKNSPSLDDTPPGYWKPYLTCSTVCSPNKDDAR